MLNTMKELLNDTVTENGAKTLATSGSYLVDFFATSGALRHAEEREIVDRFIRAYTEDRLNALKALFYTRDVRGGVGERKVFRAILNWLGNSHPDVTEKIIKFIPEYGRYDDLLALFDTESEKAAMSFIAEELEKDVCALEKGKPVSLLAKWLPSNNTSNKDQVRLARKLAKFMGISDIEYRKKLVALRKQIKIIENDLRTRNYTFDYQTVPSQAVFKYRQAFIRNDKERYAEFLEQVKGGAASMHTETLNPVQLVRSVVDVEDYGAYLKKLPTEERDVINTTWNNMLGHAIPENAIAVVDTSGSMYSYGAQPAMVALSLGLYIAERNKGAFYNNFIEFSDEPTLIELKGENFLEKLEYALTFNTVATTNIAAVFDLILAAAVKMNASQQDMPSSLILISDMEFNLCTENNTETNFEYAKRRYREAGYKLPKVVFWNVASRRKQQPVGMNENGVILVSGYSPTLFDFITDGKADPYQFMMSVLNSPRYQNITL